MNRIKIDRIVKGMILLAALIGWVLIWPVGIYRDEYISRTAADYSADTGPIHDDVAAIQKFIPQYDRIRSIGIDIGKLDGRADQGTLLMDLFDENLQLLTTVSYPVKEMKDGTLTDLPISISLEAGKEYYLNIHVVDYGKMAPVLHYRTLSGNGPVENVEFIYDQVIEDASANVRYTYEIPLNPMQILFYDSVILLAAVALWTIWERYSNGRNKEKAERIKD